MNIQLASIVDVDGASRVDEVVTRELKKSNSGDYVSGKLIINIATVAGTASIGGPLVILDHEAPR